MSKSRIFIAGHNGMVGSALIRFLKNNDFEIITKDRNQLDLLKQDEVNNFFNHEKIDQVYLAAAKVGGIFANNQYPAEFIYENLTIQLNIIHSAFLSGVKKLLFLGSSCIYPKNINRPIKEDDLLIGKLEETNEPYAIAKIAGIKMCESYNRQYGKSHGIDFRSIMPTNLYGPGDNYHSKNSHVIPGLINRFHNAKINKLTNVTIWGTGNPKREFLYVDDLARASVFVMNLDKKTYDQHISPMSSHINVGSGKDLTIKELVKIIKKVVGYKGTINYDHTKPDGNPRKFLDSNKINNLGFNTSVNLEEGLIKTYQDYKKFHAKT
jgi:GDP-L-fucose synthase